MLKPQQYSNSENENRGKPYGVGRRINLAILPWLARYTVEIYEILNWAKLSVQLKLKAKDSLPDRRKLVRC